MVNFYDGTKLLSMKDINGDKPELFMCTSNRSAGKTTYFARLCVNRFKKRGEKFAVVYRFKYDLDEVADKFFKDIQTLFFKEDTMTSVKKASGTYHELLLNEIPCGYAITLNSADTLKRMSHLFSDVNCMFFDEFQSETNHYCSNEVEKLLSIHTSIARGGGEQVRYVPVYMISNPVSLINPYYVQLGISDRLMKDTHFLRGEGYVLEQGFNESASKAQKESAFNRAFNKNKYTAYASENIYLNDNLAFIERPKGMSKYICTLRFENVDYAIRQYDDLGIIYCDNKADSSCKLKLAVTVNDHAINYVMLKSNDLLIYNLKFFFERGCFRFKDLKCKQAVLTALSYI